MTAQRSHLAFTWEVRTLRGVLTHWNIQSLVWAHHFLRSKNRKGAWSVGFVGVNVPYLHIESLWNTLKWSLRLKMFKKSQVKINNMYKTHRRRHWKIGSKNRCTNNMKTVWLLLEKTLRYQKVEYVTMFRHNCNKNFVFWDLNKWNFFLTVF